MPGPDPCQAASRDARPSRGRREGRGWSPASGQQQGLDEIPRRRGRELAEHARAVLEWERAHPWLDLDLAVREQADGGAEIARSDGVGAQNGALPEDHVVAGDL